MVGFEKMLLWLLLLSPFYRQWNQDPEGLTNLHKNMQIGRGRAGIQAEEVRGPSPRPLSMLRNTDI